MCGRFTDRYSWREIKELYDLTTPYLTSNFPPRYNIAPTQQSFVVRLAKDGSRELAELKWGLIPLSTVSSRRISAFQRRTVASDGAIPLPPPAWTSIAMSLADSQRRIRVPQCSPA
jgi:putative SOS response-associated peptidase YedK